MSATSKHVLVLGGLVLGGVVFVKFVLPMIQGGHSPAFTGGMTGPGADQPSGTAQPDIFSSIVNGLGKAFDASKAYYQSGTKSA